MVYARGRWTELEDLQLLTAIAAMPNSPWSDVAEWIPTRSPQQVRLRGVRIEKRLRLPKRPRWRNEFERLQEKKVESPFVKNPIDKLVPVDPLTDSEAQKMIQSLTTFNWKIVASWAKERSDVATHDKDDDWISNELLDFLWEDLVDLENVAEEPRSIDLEWIEF